MKSFLYRVLWCKTPLGNLGNECIRGIVSNRYLRRTLNAAYLLLGYRGNQIAYILFAKIFRNKPRKIAPGSWSVKFMGRTLEIPLRTDSLWLDWDTALSAVGHDLDLKRSYHYLLQKLPKGLVFFDVGANYGTHSLLFASGGAEVVSFEPNPTCRPYIQQLVDFNSLSKAINIQPYAVGDVAEQARLAFNPEDTWQGRICQDEGHSMRCTELVEIVTLDEFVAKTGKIPQVIKIDAEGYDYKVLVGAHQLLTNHKPIVFFECAGNENRTEIFDLLTQYGYEIVKLPLGPERVRISTTSEFLSSTGMNFGALPKPR